MGEQRGLPGVVRVLTKALIFVIAVSVVAGIAAAAVGGSLSDLGTGYGGLWGMPALSLTLVAVTLGAAAAIKMGRVLRPEEHRLRLALLVFAGVWVVVFGYSEVAHLFDPCCERVVGRQQPDRFSAVV